MSKKIYRKGTFNSEVKRDPIAVREEEASWTGVAKKPLGYDEARDALKPITAIDIDEIDVTSRLGVVHNAEIGGKLTASEAVFGNDVAIHGDLYVEGTTTTTNESQVSTSGDYIVTRENNNSQMSTTDHSGLVVNNYSTGKLGAITIKSDGTWRVSADVSSTSATFTNLVSFNGSYYNGLTDTLLDPQPRLNILTDVVAGELPNCVIYDHKFYHNDGSEWKGPETWDATNHFLQADVVTDQDLIDALDAITVQADLIYYESVTSSTISVDAEQPILTREEEGDISNNGLLKYNTATHRAEDIAVPNVDDTALFAQVDSTGLSYRWKKVAGVVFVNALPVSPNILTNLYVYTDSNGKVSYWVGNAETQTLTEMKMDAVEWVSTLPTGNNISNKVYGIYDSTDPTKSKLYFGYRDESDTAKSKTIELDVSAVEYVTSLPTGSNIKSKVYVLGKRVYVGNYDDSTIQEVGTPWFYGTKAEWQALTATEQAEYEYVVLSDDFSATNVIVDKVEKGNLNAVSSNGVWERYENPDVLGPRIYAKDLYLGNQTTHATEGGQIDLVKGTDYQAESSSISLDAYYNQFRLWSTGASGMSKLTANFDDGNLYWSKNGGTALNINGSIDTLKSDTAVGGAWKFKGGGDLADLNNYTTMGLYCFQGNITSSGQYNFPPTITGTTWGNLEVTSTNVYRVTQRITFPFSHQRSEWVRFKHDSTWSQWYCTGGQYSTRWESLGGASYVSQGNYYTGSIGNLSRFQALYLSFHGDGYEDSKYIPLGCLHTANILSGRGQVMQIYVGESLWYLVHVGFYPISNDSVTWQAFVDKGADNWYPSLSIYGIY